MITIQAVGGYGEVGRNMTYVAWNNEGILIDMGLHIENYIKVTEEEEENLSFPSTKQLIEAEALPDYRMIPLEHVKAILTTHGHLDHIGGIPFLAKKFKAPIYCTAYTKEVIQHILEDEQKKIPNTIKAVPVNTKIPLTEHLAVTFLHITHSIPQATVIIVHTPEGNIVYANDFKFDNFPTLGKAPNYQGLKKVKQARAAIIESLYVKEQTKTPPEESVRIMLKDAFLALKDHHDLIIVTTFSSHIARLKTIVTEAKRLQRHILFIGRSLAKYVAAARKAGIYDFEGVKVIKYRKEIQRKLKKIEKSRKDWLIVCTGHQGEPKSVLSRIAREEYALSLSNAVVLFSCKTIPTPTNKANRKHLEELLRAKGARLLLDLHVSGHASEEDLRLFLSMIQPELVIPSHSTYSVVFKKTFPEYQVKILKNGDKIVIKK